MKATLTLDHKEIEKAIFFYAEQHGYAAETVVIRIHKGYEGNQFDSQASYVDAEVTINSKPKKPTLYREAADMREVGMRNPADG